MNNAAAHGNHLYSSAIIVSCRIRRHLALLVALPRFVLSLFVWNTSVAHGDQQETTGYITPSIGGQFSCLAILEKAGLPLLLRLCCIK